MPSTVRFSPRETELLRLFIDGMSHCEIAGRLNISHRTVSVHLYNIRTKIGKDLDTDVRLYRWLAKNLKF